MAAKRSVKTSPSDVASETSSAKKKSKKKSSSGSAESSKGTKLASIQKFQIVHVPGAMYGVEFENQTLFTNLGGRHPVQHSSYRFLEHLVNELSERGELVVEDGMVSAPQGFDSYALLGLQREWVANEADNFSEGLVSELIYDGILERPPIDIYAQQVGYYSPAKDWLGALGARLVDLDFVDFDKVEGMPDGYWRINGGMGDEDTDDFLKLLRVLSKVFSQLSPQQRSAAVFLNNITVHSPVFSLCLVTGGCDAGEFGMGVAARHAGGMSDRTLRSAAKEREIAAVKALRFIELASGEILRPSIEDQK